MGVQMVMAVDVGRTDAQLDQPVDLRRDLVFQLVGPGRAGSEPPERLLSCPGKLPSAPTREGTLFRRQQRRARGQVQMQADAQTGVVGRQQRRLDRGARR